MARRYLMNWRPDEKRWRLMYKGKRYVVSCRQLGVGETMEASWRAANEWWEEQRKVIDAPVEDGGVAKAIEIEKVGRKLKALDQDGRRQIIDSLLGNGTYQRIVGRHDEIIGAGMTVRADRTIEIRVAEWKSLLLANHEGRQISAGRYEAYRANVDKFVQWIGPKATVDSIDEDKIEEFYTYLSSKVGAGDYSPPTAHGIFTTAKRFTRWLAQKKLIPLPGNIDSRLLRFNHSTASKIETFTIEEIRAILKACDQFSEKTKLHVLLMLGAGMYQMDIAELRQDEVDWKNGRITRARTKTRDHGGIVVTYKLWPITFSLLKKYRAKQGPLALTSGDGNPLARRWIESGKMKRYDLIVSSWNRVAARSGVAKHRLGMKHLRKTAASILASHSQYKYYHDYYLAHSPQSVSDKSYVIPSDSEFAEAMDWLGRQILGPEFG